MVRICLLPHFLDPFPPNHLSIHLSVYHSVVPYSPFPITDLVSSPVYEGESEYFFSDSSSKIIQDDDLSRLLSFYNVVVTYVSETFLLHYSFLASLSPTQFVSRPINLPHPFPLLNQIPTDIDGWIDDKAATKPSSPTKHSKTSRTRVSSNSSLSRKVLSDGDGSQEKK